MRRELIDKRKSNEKHFLNDDGTIEAIIYDDDIHYLKNNSFEEIDNNLIIKGDRFFNKSNDYDVSFSKNANNDLLDIENSTQKIRINLEGVNKTVCDKYVYNKNKLDLNNEINYYEVYDGIDLKYQILSNKLKESLIINNKDSIKNNFIFNLETNLDYKFVDKSILFYEGDKTYFKIEAPFMIDSNNLINDNIYYEIERVNDKYRLILNLDIDWLNDEARVYPITIDPTITTKTTDGLQDTFISSKHPDTNFNDRDYLLAGSFDNGTDICRSLIKFGLPTIGTGSSIIDASLYLNGYPSGTIYYNPLYLNTMIINQVTGDWNESTVTWNNMGNNYSDLIRDFYADNIKVANIDHTYQFGGSIFNITNIVKKWYDNELNYGLMVRSIDEVYAENKYYGAYVSKNNNFENFNPKPLLAITYRNQNGLESYMTYQQKSLTNGTIYLNNYNGNLITSFNLGNTIGGVLPASLNLFYNTNDVILNHDYGFGIGMKLNFHQTIKLVTIEEENMYEYVDEDGTVHYFRKKEETDTTYIDEDGLSLTLEVNDNDCNIKDKDKNTMNFMKINDKYYLNSIKDTKGNMVSITYTDNKITKVIDASDNEINITYGDDIVINCGKTTTLSFDGNKLTAITNYLGTTNINYNNHNIISEIIDINNLKTTFEYYDVIPYRIKKMSEYSLNNTLGKYLEFEYSFLLTSIKNEKNKIISYIFNNYGNTVGISDLKENEEVNDGYGNMYDYNNIGTSKNQYTGSSQMIKHINNLIYNSSFEKDILYFNTNTLNISFSKDEHLSGKRSLKLNGLGTAYMDIDILNNKYYTFSCYTKSDVNFKLKLESSNETKEITILASNSFERNGVTIYNSEISPNLKISFILEETGTIYVDDIQLEEGKIANYYNLIDNSSFEKGAAGWNIDNHQYELGESLLDNGLINNDEIVTLSNGKKALKLFCYPNSDRVIEKYFENDGEALEFYYISFWYKNEGVQIDKNQNMYKSNQIYGRFFYDEEHGGNDVMWETVLNPSNDEWQFASNYLSPEFDYKDFEILLTSFSNANYLYVTDFTLVKGIKREAINYDSNGNIISTHDKSRNKTKFKYDNNNQLIKMTDTLGNNFNFEYDNDITNRVLRGISPTGITNQIKYDNYGNPNVTRISNFTEINLKSGNYYIRKKGTDFYLKREALSKKLILDNNSCSHQKWKIKVLDNTVKIKSILFSPTYIDYSTVFDDISFEFIEQDNDSYLLKTNDKYLTYKDNKFILDNEEDLNNQQFYFEKDDTYFIENEAIYSSDGKFLTKTIDTLFNTTTYDIDDSTGLVNSITDPLNNITNYTYNSKDQLIKITKNDMEVDYTYNNNLLTSIKTNLKEYLFNYDEFLNVKSIYIGNSKLIENNYENNNGNLLSSTYGNNDLISYEYDDFNRVSKINKMNDTYEYYYDNFGNLKRIDSNDNTYLYYYDLAQRLNEYKESNFKIKYDYNELNNLVSKIQTLNNFEYQYEFEYNSEDNISKITNDDTIINYTYDELGRLISKDINNNINAYSYVNNGKRTSTLVDTYNNSLNTYKYKYDKLGNITKVYKDDDLISKYYYDSYNELIKEESNNIIEYSYDLYGNILSKKIFDLENSLINENTYQYNNSWVDQLTKYNDIDITYDEIGNPLTIGDITLDWINGRQLNSYNNFITYKYNKDGIRTEKKVNNVKTKYYLEGNKIIFCQNNENVLYFIYENDNLIGFKYNDDKYYYIKNIQEDIIGIMDNTSQQVVSYEYDSWGNILSIKDNNNNDISNDLTHIANINPFRYRSYYYDIETKLYYLNSRYYNPEWGRFINADKGVATPGELKGYNMYEYAFNNPINFNDGEGNWPKWLKVIAVAVAVVVVAAAVTVAVATTGGAAAVIAAGVLKGAATGAVIGAVGGAISGAVSHTVSTGSTKGVGQAAVAGAVTGAVTGAASGAVLGGISSSIQVGQAANAWNSGGTYKSGYDSMTNHYQRQVINKEFANGNNILKYTNDALNFMDRNKSILQYTNPSRTTMVPGWTTPYSSGTAGGWFTSEGKILTFWYK